MFYHNMQDRENDCGLAVIITVLQQLGLKKVNLNTIKDYLTKDIEQGLSLKNIIDVFSEFSLTTGAYEIENQAVLKELETPFIAMVRNKGLPHYVVIHQIKGNHIIISNPAKSEVISLEKGEFFKDFLDYIVLIEDKEKVKEPPTPKKQDFLTSFYDQVMEHVPLKTKLIVILFSLLKFMIPILIIIGFQYIILFQVEEITLYRLLLYMSLSLSFLTIYYFVNQYNLQIKRNIEEKMQETMVLMYYQNILLNKEKYEDENQVIGSFWNILLAVPGIVQKFYFKVDFINTIIFFLLIGFINIYLALFSLLMLFIFVFMLKMNMKEIHQFQKGFVMEVNRFGASIMETIHSLLDIQVFKKKDESAQFIKNSVNDYATAKKKIEKAESNISIIHDLFVYFMIIGGFMFYLIAFMLHLNVSIMLLFLGLFLLFMLAANSKNTFNIWLEHEKSKVSIEYLQHDRKEMSHITKKSETRIDMENIRDIKLENITKKFADNPVLENIHLHLSSGEIIGIKGNNGSGKTTLLKIFAGLITPDSGNIIINNEQKLSTLEDTTILHHVMLYHPEFHVYNNTVENNYLYNVFDSKEDTRVNQREFHFPLELPNHYVVSSDARNISLGQKNKILLSRSLHVDRDIYLFDEPTASLDMKTREIFIQNVNRLAKKENKIVVVVSHDSFLLDHCDKVIQMEDSKEVEH